MELLMTSKKMAILKVSGQMTPWLLQFEGFITRIVASLTKSALTISIVDLDF